MLTRIDHIDLKVPDLEEAVSFFKSIGLIEIRRTAIDLGGSVEVALPGENQVLLEIRQVDGIAGTTIDHIAFKVDANATALAELKAAGVTFTREDHLVPRTGRRVSNFKDPRGGKWQLTD